MEYGLIGEHLPHSFSKEIHGLCANYDYCLKELTPQEVPDFLREKNFKAINVTIPYKQTVIPFLEKIDAAAAEIGAVNTVICREGKLYGYNTDFYGMTALLRHMHLSLRGKKVLILGTGGTACTARAVAKAEGAAEIRTVGRNKATVDCTYEEACKSCRDTQVIINTTPCGMYPYADGSEERAATPINIASFPGLCGVLDAVYNPLRTNLVLEAQQRGIPAEGGLYMLVAQAVKASQLFLGQPEEGLEGKTDEIYAKIRAEKENIVLIGMPACGKTTVGKVLAESMNRPFLDTDEEIVRVAQKSIPDIFAQEGEEAFRNRETEAVLQIANQKSGYVIATGGGAILREENLRALRRTGRLYFLNRPLSLLMPTKDRPLASSAEQIKKRYEERFDRYKAACHREIAATSAPETLAEIIRKDFLS